MTLSDDYGFDDDDTAFIAAASQFEATQNAGGFEASPRPYKRRRVGRQELGQIDGASSNGQTWSGSDREDHSPPRRPRLPKSAAHEPTQVATITDDENVPEIDEDYYFPGEQGEEVEKSTSNSRHKIHVPKNGGQFENMIFTQTQVGLDSSPGRFRGPVWKRPMDTPPPVFNAQRDPLYKLQSNNVATSGKPAMNQTTLGSLRRPVAAGRVSNAVESDAAMAIGLQAQGNTSIRRETLSSRALPQEIYDELADLPSDAFSSSSPEKSPHKEVIELSSQVTASQVAPQRMRGPQAGLKQMTIFGQPATQDVTASQAGKKKHAWPLKSRDEAPTHHKLEEVAMKTWVFPTNLGTTRDYQYNIVSRSLFHNTLVALPTGLGKTFIAATIMLNYYRWTSDAQIVFMAPTKPLIAQQMEACYNIVGIHRNDTVLMTGETTPAIRGEEWQEKRVFFMTPQTVINDLKSGICDPKKIVLLVVDEAHKATGSYAYTEVVAFMRRFTPSFRVLALTATPGSTVEAVQAVIDHLGIARVELRTEQSLDIRPYTHEKHTEVELFDYSDEQQLVMEHLSKALRPVLEKLASLNAYWSRDPMTISAYGLTTARSKWMSSDAGKRAPMPVKGMANAAFTVLSQFGHSIGLLKNHGIIPFYTGALGFQKNVDSGQTKGKSATAIVEHEDFVKMMGRIRGWTSNPDFIGHPKLQYLREVVLNHFLDAGEGGLGSDAPPSATRVMVFASYRDSTEDICRVLKRNEPMIRPHVFVGQASSNNSEGMNQKKQNAVIQDFKAGKYNTLVATSIGEEGLDIGDIDLIACYDASSSPIRMLQRIGRTGRKRVGKVTLLLMRGKEEADYAKAQDSYSFIQKSIADTSRYEYKDDQSPRILPKEAQPIVDKRVIEIPIENTQQPIDLNEKGRRARGKGKTKRPPKKFHMPDGVRTGFTKASKLDVGSDDEEGGEGTAPLTKKQKTAAATKRAAAKPKKQAALAEPEPQAAQLPFLEDVLLSGAQQRELESKYAYTRDDGDQIIRAPDIGRFPEAFCELGVTKYLRHGRSAKDVSNALRRMKAADSEKLSWISTLADDSKALLASPGSARIRLAESHASDSETDLPREPLPAPQPKKKKPRQRPQKKPARKPMKRATSYSSAAMEGEESEPEATQANMQLATQIRLGEELGSRDTSGEEEEEEADSELEAFIAKSDEVIETVSSSVPASQEQPSRKFNGQAKGRGLMRRKAAAVDLISSEEQEESVSDDTVTEAAPAAPTRRKQKRVVDSESE
ncbi:hypothetical protein B0A50_04192 [Salinomyces thailandicus]|uniref:ATP-dependent DNA helicase n=1 Tax=Salinomyces thailandicus TaxID=706561 RepID=A0A4U0U021_9PEZI|nr:hypothetical protein B0A50_04192 [Salinomyces thailandica]